MLFTVIGWGRTIVVRNGSELLSAPNSRYVIKTTVDLKGKTVKILDGCCLVFKSNGKIVNGTIVGNKTKLKSLKCGCFGVKVEGSWVVSKICDDFFDFCLLTDNQVLDNISAMQSDRIKNTIILRRGKYSVVLSEKHKSALLLKSNTILKSSSDIVVEGNDLTSYSVLKIGSSSNVRIYGGSITGDVGNHTYRTGTTSEWGFGISLGSSKDVIIDGVTISRCTGDGIYIGGGKGEYVGDYTNASKNIQLLNVISTGNRRQGVSITCADGVVIRNCKLSDTGKYELTSPGCGLDIEPNEGQSVRNVTVTGCEFNNNGDIMDASVGGYVAEGSRCNIEGILFNNCIFSGRLSIRSGSLIVKDCSMATLSIHLAKMPKNKVLIERSQITGGSGVIVRSTGRTTSVENMPEYVFRNCSINMQEALTPAIFSTINHKGNEVANFVIDGGSISYPSGNKRFALIQSKTTCSFDFSNCQINPKEQSLDLTNKMFRNCQIRKDIK